MKVYWALFFIHLLFSTTSLACKIDPDYKTEDPFISSILKELDLPITNYFKANSGEFTASAVNPLLNLEHALLTVEPHLVNCQEKVRATLKKIQRLRTALKLIASAQSDYIFVSSTPEFVDQINDFNVQFDKMLKATPAARAEGNNFYQVIIDLKKKPPQQEQKPRYLKSDAKTIWYTLYLGSIDALKLETYHELVTSLRRIHFLLPLRFKRDLPFKNTHFLWAKLDFLDKEKLQYLSEWSLYLILFPALIFGIFKSIKNFRLHEGA